MELTVDPYKDNWVSLGEWREGGREKGGRESIFFFLLSSSYYYHYSDFYFFNIYLYFFSIAIGTNGRLHQYDGYESLIQWELSPSSSLSSSTSLCPSSPSPSSFSLSSTSSSPSSLIPFDYLLNELRSFVVFCRGARRGEVGGEEERERLKNVRGICKIMRIVCQKTKQKVFFFFFSNSF